ncbi:hypothetical protein AgCh_022462 [Apium graveolens]
MRSQEDAKKIIDMYNGVVVDKFKLLMAWDRKNNNYRANMHIDSDISSSKISKTMMIGTKLTAQGMHLIESKKGLEKKMQELVIVDNISQDIQHERKSMPDNCLNANVEDESNSRINPNTPRPASSCEFKDQDRENEVWNVSDRSSDEFDSKEFYQQSVQTELYDSKEIDIMSRCSSQPSLIKNLQCLEIKSNRGRPKSSASAREVKAFKVPKRIKKYSKIGLETIHFEDNGVMDEVKAIFDTGVQLGLIPVRS